MSKRTLNINVLKVSQPIGDFFIAAMPAKDLVDISYKDVRRLAEEQRDFERYLGIQRPVSTKRIREIKTYIESRDATFPTAVILAIDSRCAEYDEQTRTLSLHEYTPETGIDDEKIPFDRIAKVIDGQHRIAAFMDENDNWNFEFENKVFDVNVSIFIGADVSEQANIFATVNLAQTKVNKSLVYDLTELAKTRSPFKTCHNVAVALDIEKQSPLHQRIKRLGTSTPGRKNEPLTQASFVESLIKFISATPEIDRNKLLDGKKLEPANEKELLKVPFRNLFIQDKELDIAEIIFNYFSAVRRKWPNAWDATDQTGNLLPRSNAFKALMQFLKDDIYLKAVGAPGEIPTIEKFYSFFEEIEFKDDTFTTKEFSPGSGGQSAFIKMLRSKGKSGIEVIGK